MSDLQSRIVVDRDGAHATILEHVRREDAPSIRGVSTQASAEEVLLKLPSGLRFWLPLNLLRERDDGTYRVTLSFARLAGEVEPEEYAKEVVDTAYELVERDEATGRVRLARTIREREEIIDEPILRDEVSVRRVPVGRTVDGPLESRYEDDTLIIPVMREELVVERRWVLVEEIHVTRMRGEERRPERAHAQSERVSVYREMRPEDGRS